MTKQSRTLCLDYGIDFRFLFYWRPDANSPRVDLSTYTAQVQVRPYADISSQAVLSLSSDGLFGTSRIRLDQTDTGGDSYGELIILAADQVVLEPRQTWSIDLVLTTNGISQRVLKGSTLYVRQGVTQPGDFV